MWAGYAALANQLAAAGGIPAIGFINPAIYEIGLSSSYDTYFHDITSGWNLFPAVIGYDLNTGWGSPNGANLINALVGLGRAVQVSGAGTISVPNSGAQASFCFDASQPRGSAPIGQLYYANPATGDAFVATINAVIVAGNTADLSGTCTFSNQELVSIGVGDLLEQVHEPSDVGPCNITEEEILKLNKTQGLETACTFTMTVQAVPGNPSQDSFSISGTGVTSEGGRLTSGRIDIIHPVFSTQSF